MQNINKLNSFAWLFRDGSIREYQFEFASYNDFDILHTSENRMKRTEIEIIAWVSIGK